VRDEFRFRASKNQGFSEVNIKTCKNASKTVGASALRATNPRIFIRRFKLRSFSAARRIHPSAIHFRNLNPDHG
jgi:hypothetical protein